MSYLEKTTDIWQAEYDSENVEAHIFRAYGRCLKMELDKLGGQQKKVLDFGCGSGAALGYFRRQGLDVYGVDVSRVAIDTCKRKMNDIDSHFSVIPPSPSVEDDFFGEKFDLVVSMQVLYYLNDTDLAIRLQSIYNQMRPGALIYVSMVGEQCYWFKNSSPAEGGTRLVRFENDRYTHDDHHMAFTASREQLLEKFTLFETLHIGYYDAQYLESEGSEFHYTFIGKKST